jgi:hypothetical protein
MKITIELTEDSHPEAKFDMVIEDTEHEAFKWVTIDGKKYSVTTADLQMLTKIYN